ncbi:MAG TPA: glycosyltransferase family 2 protein [Candidatus Saccharimonadales bacterium]
MNTVTRPKVSVVLCTYNRAPRLAACLDALQNQSIDSNLYEVVVVNDGSKDNTAEILAGRDFKIITNSPNQGLAQSRNNGASASQADIIAFTDDDCVPHPDWLKNLLEQYSDSSVAAVGGKIIPKNTNHWLLKYYEANNPLAHVTFTYDATTNPLYVLCQYIKRSFALRQLPDARIRLHMIVGANMSMRRSVFEATGGFDPCIKFGGEEEDIWIRFRQLQPDAVLRYEPKAVVRHDYEASLKDALRRNRSYGLGAARAYFKQKDRLPVVYPFPFVVLATLLLGLLSPWLLAVFPMMVLMLYAGWIRLAVARKHPAYLLYSAVQMTLELANSWGFIQGVVHHIWSARGARNAQA